MHSTHTTQAELDAYTVAETAAVLQVTRQWVHQLVKDGKLGVVYSGGGTRWLVTGDSIRAALKTEVTA